MSILTALSAQFFSLAPAQRNHDLHRILMPSSDIILQVRMDNMLNASDIGKHILVCCQIVSIRTFLPRREGSLIKIAHSALCIAAIGNNHNAV